MVAFANAPFQIIEGDALHALGKIPAGTAHCCVTSPPYYGLRDYGVEPTAWPAVEYAPMPGCATVTVPPMVACLGLEPTPEAFVGHLVLIFREVRRVLRDDGTLWLNLGDSYSRAAETNVPQTKHKRVAFPVHAKAGSSDGAVGRADRPGSRSAAGSLKPKDLLGIPWRVAFALQADGWWLRMDNIWHKPNPMPESVTDRPTKAHEYVFLLAKSARYYYDAEAVKERAVSGAEAAYDPGTNGLGGGDRQTGATTRRFGADPAKRNRRSVWTVGTKPYKGDHYATFNTELVDPCIMAGSPVGGTVLDPFSGRATTGVAALQLGRRYIGTEIHPKHAAESVRRLHDVQPALELYASHEVVHG
jgi:DNA modification methylase